MALLFGTETVASQATIRFQWAKPVPAALVRKPEVSHQGKRRLMRRTHGLRRDLHSRRPSDRRPTETSNPSRRRFRHPDRPQYKHAEKTRPETDHAAWHRNRDRCRRESRQIAELMT